MSNIYKSYLLAVLCLLYTS
ncbi:DUF1270 family protein, partial [Staphylococcus aureus]|nr:DUF1270 family protein [Staphylococcus aureus]